MSRRRYCDKCCTCLVSDTIPYARVYVDGACASNGRSGARGGYGVYWGPNDPRNLSEPLLGRQTNNRAEIVAAETAIEQAKDEGYREVTVYTDSQFLIKSINKWMPRWLENGWRTKNGEPVINREDFESLARTSIGIQVIYEYVPGHAGNPGNEAADRLAREGAMKNF